MRILRGATATLRARHGRQPHSSHAAILENIPPLGGHFIRLELPQQTTLMPRGPYPIDYPVVAEFRNDTKKELSIHLELVPEEVILSPGHKVELLARPDPDLLPITIDYFEGGLQVFANKVFDPDWHVRFKGIVIKAGNPLRLADHE